MEETERAEAIPRAPLEGGDDEAVDEEVGTLTLPAGPTLKTVVGEVTEAPVLSETVYQMFQVP